MTDINYSAAVNECENCGKACETLHDLSDGWNFKACDQCAEDAAREDAREAEELRKAREAAAAAERNSLQWVLSQAAPYFACIGNGLYVRTGSGKKRRTR